MISFVRNLALAAVFALVPAVSHAGVLISVNIAPPALPVYTQPLCPGDGYLWTPGYWAWGEAGYYWVPGVWVRPPQIGLLWTPGYWGWSGGAYLFNAGYWGPHVGFYGGINYGFGFGGVGFAGGRWDGGHFAYNTAVVNVDRTVIHNTYVQNTTVNNTVINNHASFNGGTGGVQARPSAQEAQFQHEQHLQPTSEQQQHFQAAAMDRGNLASANHGHPQMAAARTANEYHAVAQQHAATQPITPRDRALNQQQRIGNGVKSGQLTAGETHNLEGREAGIHHQAAQDRAANGGRLNQQERQQIAQRQNNVSRSINEDKHNQDKHNAAQQPRSENRPNLEGHPNEGHPHER